MKIRIYGASDDLIEVEGDICEEFPCFTEDGCYMGVSDGTLLRANYNDDGNWVFSMIKKGSCDVKIVGMLEKENKQEYSDEVLIEGDISWILCGERFEAVKK